MASVGYRRRVGPARNLWRVPRCALRLLFAVCLLAAVGLLVGSIIGLGSGCLFLAPAVLLAFPLLGGRYLGAERLSRLTRTRTLRRTTVTPAYKPRMWTVLPPRGGMLIAASLAVRPPPLRIAAR